MADDPEQLEAETEQPEEGQEPQPEAEKRTPWFQKRINELTTAKRAEEQAKLQLARENEALRAMLPKAEGKTEGARTPADPDFETAVQQAAAQRAKQAEFDRASADVYEKGMAAYPGKFPGAIANLQAAGVLTADNTTFVEAALASEAPERVLYELGQNPEEAMRLASMSPTQLAIALDRMARNLKEKPISESPPPIQPLGQSRVAKAFDAADTKTTNMAQWLREREKQVAERKASR